MRVRWVSGLLALPVLLETCYAKRDYDAHDYYAVHLQPGVSPDSVSSQLGLQYEGPLGELEDHYIFRALERQHEYDHITTAISDLKRRRRKRDVGSQLPHILDSVLLSQKQELHKRFPLVKRGPLAIPTPASPAPVPRQSYASIDEAVQSGIDLAKNLNIADPIFQEQWHLNNYLQLGHDINVTGLWAQNITGHGSTVCIVDDGLDMDSDDLKPNYFAAGSWDFNDVGPDPRPRLSDDRHGTRCAGEVSAARNDVCGVGVAYDSRIAGVRILSKLISNADEAVALNYAYQETDIYSCSWGPPDNGQSMEAPDILIARAMVNGVQKGRGGKGSIFVFAIGNGAAVDDNCNFDGYTNSIYSVSVGGIDRKGLHPYYSEKCSAQLVVTYSSGSGDAIHTTDVGQDKCYSNHGGTSAAGPLVAGIYALALQVNPKLTWRDIQYLTILSAVKIEQPSDWAMNKAVGKEFSHQFGYGKADAWALVDMAKHWTNVKPQAWYFGPWLHVKHAIPQGEKGLASHFEVTKDMLRDANLERLEHVTVTMNVNHTRRGDLSVELKSPSGMISHIATHRRSDEAPEGYDDWTFMSVAHWGESGVGKWTVVVKDTNVNEHKGIFTDWRIKLYGEARDAKKATVLPLPKKHDDDDHDVVETETASAHTTTVAVPTETGNPPGNPDDHHHRPVNSKISTTKPSNAQPTSALETPTEDAVTSPTPTGEADKDSNFLPRPFPTFGASKRTQIWIYGALALILAFLAGLGGWWYWMRRKKRWMERDDYGFEMVDRDDDDEGAPLANGFAADKARGGKGRKKRAGELYDAFAEGSEDEEGVFGLGSEDESEDEHSGGAAGRYRDEEPFREGVDVR
ncbi:pheromone processing endoprotease [Extremus antarcticus]|uniref:Pheromone processing endoprotease n=1 Tax=Extremus antarcticus TaxID=702011 RepID=A0AAJ0GCS2_9PEZI|nr:pheromone processing endoprotease [Extremus antarcticus]